LSFEDKNYCVPILLVELNPIKSFTRNMPYSLVDLINLDKISKIKTTKNETIKSLINENKNVILLFLKDVKKKTG
jgi:hypothetical protein